VQPSSNPVVLRRAQVAASVILPVLDEGHDGDWSGGTDERGRRRAHECGGGIVACMAGGEKGRTRI
jgi:hypothetical protein